MRKETGLSFDDVLLVPRHSSIKSRADVDIGTKLGRMQLRLPILSSNMDTVTEFEMAFAMGRNGGAGVLHRFTSIDEQVSWAHQCISNSVPAIVSVGVDEKEAISLIRRLYERDVINTLDAVCVDVAHGDHERVAALVFDLRKRYKDLDIIAGNVATGGAAYTLVNAGANIIKVGIGPGSVCSTRVVSGHGVPQLTAIADVHRALVSHGLHEDVQIIADGGIRYPGDIVKALAAGADAVMLGSLLAGTTESPGDRIIEHGLAYKTFRGSASYAAQKEKRGRSKPRVEGVSARVPFRGDVADTLSNLADGIRSGFSYSGARTLAELHEHAEFMRVTPNGLREGQPHTHMPYTL